MNKLINFFISIGTLAVIAGIIMLAVDAIPAGDTHPIPPAELSAHWQLVICGAVIFFLAIAIKKIYEALWPEKNEPEKSVGSVGGIICADETGRRYLICSGGGGKYPRRKTLSPL